MTSKISLTLASLVVMTAAASAQTVIDLTGSTAARSAAHNAILATLTVNNYAYEGNAIAGNANRAIYHGTFAGNPYIIRTWWAGSVNGVRDIAQQIQQTQLFDKSVTGTAGGLQITTAPTLAPASAETAPEIGFSDVFQSSTAFTSPALAVEDEVGIIPFKWFKNEGASAGLTNMTPLLGRALYGSLGELPLSLFTGVPTDAARTVFVTGRNADSGSRITTMAELGYSVFLDVNQYTFTSSGGVITGSTPTGNNGYASGGNYAQAVLGSTSPGFDIVSYLGSSDWTNALNAGAVELTWNGVPYSESAVQEGRYTFWGYLHQNRMVLTGNSLAFYNALKTSIQGNPGSVLVKDDAAMKVARDGDGAPVFPK
jgi:hypothetical protein